MNAFNVITAFIIFFMLACNSQNSGNGHSHNHGAGEHTHHHEEGDDHSRDHEKDHQQEQFIVTGDSIQIVTDSTHHTHEDGTTHPNH